MDLLPRFGPWALVTGASAGIGRAYARALADRGFKLILVARRAHLLAELAEELPTEVVAAPVDLRRPDFLQRLEPHLAGRPVGLLVNNAAIARTGPLLQHPLDEELDVLALNAAAPLRLTHRLAPEMVQRGRGAVVFLSSTVAWNGGPFIAGYAATKAWSRSLAESLAVELQPHGVVVQCVAPGMTDTEGLRGSVDMDRLVIPPMRADEVAELGLSALGRRSVVVPGLINKLTTALSQRLLPGRVRHRLMAAARPFTG